MIKLPRFKRRQTETSHIQEQEDRARDKEVEQSLNAIYADEKGAVPDMTVLDHHRKSRLITIAGIAFGVVMLLCAMAWAAITWLSPYKGFAGHGLQIVIDGPSQVSLGQESTYFINWQNTLSDPIGSADIRVSFPSDFMLTSVDPVLPSKEMDWRLGSIVAHGRGTITVKGVFTGALGTQTAIQAVALYRPASFNSDFEEVGTLPLAYTGTVLQGVFLVPVKVLPGDTVKIQYVIQNTGTQLIKGAEARITLPEGFVRTASSTIQMDGRTSRTPIGDLAAGASTTVIEVGTFASGVFGEEPLHGEVGTVTQDGVFQAILKTDATVAVLAGDISSKLVVNGSDADRSMGFGETLHATIAYQNTSAEELKDVQVRWVVLPLSSGDATSSISSVLNWKLLDDTASGTRSLTSITWAKKQIATLGRLTPQQDGTIEFSIPLKEYTASTTVSGFQMIAETMIGSIGSTVVNRIIRSAPIAVRFRTDATLAVEARYFSEEGAQIGAGPLPPVVGQSTSYRVSWTLSKHLHELKGLEVKATLPKNVTWMQNASIGAGEVKYDSTSRVITWTLNRLPANMNEARVEFDVQLTPSEFDAGRFADLMGETRSSFTDAPLNESMLFVTPGITTDLTNDDGAKNKGLVRKP